MAYIAFSIATQNSLARANTEAEALRLAVTTFGIEASDIEVLPFSIEDAGEVWNTLGTGLPLYQARAKATPA